MGLLDLTVRPGPPSQVETEAAKTDPYVPGSAEPADGPIPSSITTYVALVMLVALWAAQFYATWAAWGNLTIDSGHEMYIPALLAQGKVLYADVWYPYGPAAPYFNSYLFRLFGAHLNVLYWAGSLSALGSALFLFLAGMRLSSWYVGWTAGAVVLLEAFQPSIFCFPLPYSFAAVYGCLIACLFLWLTIVASTASGSLWMLGAGTAAATALLVKPEFGAACYATVVLLVPVRGYLQRSWRRVARDILAVVPGVVLCGLVIAWMVSIAGVEFITQENLVGWPTSYFMKTYGPMWLERNGFTVSVPAFKEALFRAIPVGAVLASYCVLWWKTSNRRANLMKALLLLAVTSYCASAGYFGSLATAERLLTKVFFPQDMVLYVSLAAAIAWYCFWMRRKHGGYRTATVAILLTFSGLLGLRILMRMLPNEYPIYYNGPVVLSFLLLLGLMIPRSGLARRFAFLGQLAICAACLAAVALATTKAQAQASSYVPLTTERGTIRVSKHLAEQYEAAIGFMKEKAAQEESVLSVPEDTSLYFLSGTYCPMRVFLFTPGIVAPGIMTEKAIREIEQGKVAYVLWSNRRFPGYGAPVFGRDFNREVGDYLKSHYHRVGPLLANTGQSREWTAVVWKRNQQPD